MKNKILIGILLTLIVLFGVNYFLLNKTIAKAQKQQKYDYLYPIVVDGKYGFINIEGKQNVKPQYDYVGNFSEGAVRVCKKNSNKIGGNQSCGYVNLLGKEFIPLKYDAYAGNFSEGVARVCKTFGNVKKCGFIDKTEKEIIPLKYDNIGDSSEGLPSIKFSEGLISIKQDNKWGYIDKTDKIVINPQFEEAQGFSEGLAAVKQDNKWGFIDKTGKIIIKPQFDFVDNFSEGLDLVGNEIENGYQKGGFIDKNGLLKIKFNKMLYPDYNKPFREGLATDINCNYIDKSGKVTLNLAKSGFSRVGYMGRCQNFSDGLLIVSYGGKNNSFGNRNRNWGYINTKGELVIKAPVVINEYIENYLSERDYDDFVPIFNYSEGLAKVEILYKSGRNKISTKMGFINKKGLFAIKPKFTAGCNREFRWLDEISPYDYRDQGFHQGLARVQDSLGYGYINKQGKWVWFNKYSKNDLLNCIK